MNMLIRNKLINTDKCIKQNEKFIWNLCFLYSNLWYFFSIEVRQQYTTTRVDMNIYRITVYDIRFHIVKMFGRMDASLAIAQIISRHDRDCKILRQRISLRRYAFCPFQSETKMLAFISS